jgi:hypothetical protein
MTTWREQLNRIAAEFWCDVGDSTELPKVADAANAELGEAHPAIWDFYTPQSPERNRQLVLDITSEINGFVPGTWESERALMIGFRKALQHFVAGAVPPQVLCKLVNRLDAVFVVGHTPRPNSLPRLPISWLGDLWNCCDWCDETWSRENSLPLVSEAVRVLELIDSYLSATQADG